MSQLKSKTLRNLGIALFILSFLIPDWRGDNDFAPFGGARIFIVEPFFALDSFSHSDNYWSSVEEKERRQFDAIVILATWTANFTIFFRLPWLLALIPIALPWIAYARGLDLVKFLPFYPWALGITFIHVSRMLKREPDHLGSSEPT